MIFRLALLALLLGAVLYVMSFFRSEAGTQGTQDFFEALMTSGQKPYNWCGANAGKLLIDGKEVSSNEAPLYCEALIDTSFQSLPKDDFSPVAQFDSEAEVRVLELNSEGVLRSGGVPFKSEALRQRLKAMSK